MNKQQGRVAWAVVILLSLSSVGWGVFLFEKAQYLYHNVSWPPDAEMVMMMAVTIRLPFLAMLSALVVPTVLIGGLALIRARNSGGESRGELVGETAPP